MGDLFLQYEVVIKLMKEFDSITIYNEDALEIYNEWDKPTTIISDGAYGVNGFPTDTNNVNKLKDWYRNHIQSWSEYATAETTLWLWNTEIGWANIHPLLEKNGWNYRGLNIWNKGIQHIAGNSNTKTLRKFPQVTEVCAHYIRSSKTTLKNKDINVQDWIRDEWEKTGLNFNKANEACNVSDAATRKYLTSGDEWYFPPKNRFEKLIKYANEHGCEENKPYFTINGSTITHDDLKKLRGKFDCPVGVTNVWDCPPLHTDERVKNDDGEYIHLNQKPKKLIRRIIQASSNEDDIIWEPFGGLCTGGIVAKEEDRTAFCSEIEQSYYNYAIKRFKSEFSL